MVLTNSVAVYFLLRKREELLHVSLQKILTFFRQNMAVFLRNKRLKESKVREIMTTLVLTKLGPVVKGKCFLVA